eukprot:Lithocolla_globosa_v1_NODE_1_length_16663_cov_42.954359.p3 type:complete len:472 gc:universal NODE_1_length_16663_cov_42.954359:6983-8398(+)
MPEIVPGYWNVGGEIVSDNSTTEFEYRQFLEKNSNNLDQNGPYEIRINERDNYILPHKAYTLLGISIRSSDGTAHTDTMNVTLINNAAQAFFRDCDYRINDVSVEKHYNNGVRSLIHNLLDYSDDYSRSQATDQCWYPDTNTGDADRAPFTLTGNTTGNTLTTTSAANPGAITDAELKIRDSATYNKGFADRRVLTTGNDTTVYFRVPLARLFGFTKHITHVFSGATHTMVFTKENVNNLVFRDGTPAAALLRVSTLEVWMPILKPSLQVRSALSSMLAKDQSIPLAWEYSNVYPSPVFTGANVIWNVTSQSERPTKVFVVIQNVADLNDQTANNAIFRNKTCTNMYIKIGSEQFPLAQYEPDFASGKYNREFHALIKCAGKSLDVDSGCQVTYKNFATLYPIFAFDVSHVENQGFFKGTKDITVHATVTHGGNAVGPPVVNNDYQLWAMVTSDREASLNIRSQQMLVEVK